MRRRTPRPSWPAGCGSCGTRETVRSFDPDYEREEGQSHALAARCDSAAEVDATVARLAALGHRVVREPWDAAWGQRYATVADPDGYRVDLFSPLPG